jgi:hypothetical protein
MTTLPGVEEPRRYAGCELAPFRLGTNVLAPLRCRGVPGLMASKVGGGLATLQKERPSAKKSGPSGGSQECGPTLDCRE